MDLDHITCKGCQHHYCKRCLKKLLVTSRECLCKDPFKPPHAFEEGPPVLMNEDILHKLRFRCRQVGDGCKEIVPYQSLHQHERVCYYRGKFLGFC